MASDSLISASASLQPDPPISPSSKGKAPMEELELELELDDSVPAPASCGICLSEEGQSVRGCIDSCDHYFCFLCIIEWSKIESRCPLCKQRFSSIRRMRTDGTLIGDRAVSVPVRNQIYDPHRNMTSGPPDPYSNISCNICTGSSDENLMLLCDLCDTAVHTYCAGLGATIPEGDWFCQECAQMKAEESNSEPSANLGSSPTPDHNTEKLSVQPPTSIFDIVRAPGEPDPEVHRLMTLFSPQQQQSLSSSNSLPHQAHRNIAGPSRRGSSTCMKSEIKVTESSVRTLNRCRDVNKYIRELRENWNALRSGTLNFSSQRFDSGASNNSRMNNTSRGHQSDGSLCGDTTNKGSYDVDRAWKMFNIAKSKQPQKLSGTSALTSKSVSLKVSSSKDSKNLFLGESCKTVPSKTKSNTYTGFKMQQSLKKHDGCGSKGSGPHVNGTVFGRENTTINHTGLATAASPGKCTFSSKNKNMHKSIKKDVLRGTAGMSSQEKLGQGSLHVCREHVFSSSTKSLSGSLTGASGVPCTNLQKKPSSLSFEACSGQNFDSDSKHTRETESNQSQEFARKRGNAENIRNGSKRIKVDIEAKSEIQSLVKLNLKLLSAGKKLEVDEFKHIAWYSTHEILAACGLEPRRHNKSPIQKPNCSHDDQSKQQSKLSLMPSSCRECFYVFVKDVVSSVMSEKISC